MDVVADFGVCIRRSSPPPSNAILGSGEYIFHPVHIIAITYIEYATWIVTLYIRIYVYQVRLQLKADLGSHRISIPAIMCHHHRQMMHLNATTVDGVKEEGICSVESDPS